MHTKHTSLIRISSIITLTVFICTQAVPSYALRPDVVEGKNGAVKAMGNALGVANGEGIADAKGRRTPEQIKSDRAKIAKCYKEGRRKIREIAAETGLSKKTVENDLNAMPELKAAENISILQQDIGISEQIASSRRDIEKRLKEMLIKRRELPDETGNITGVSLAAYLKYLFENRLRITIGAIARKFDVDAQFVLRYLRKPNHAALARLVADVKAMQMLDAKPKLLTPVYVKGLAEEVGFYSDYVPLDFKDKEDKLWKLSSVVWVETRVSPASIYILAGPSSGDLSYEYIMRYPDGTEYKAMQYNGKTFLNGSDTLIITIQQAEFYRRLFRKSQQTLANGAGFNAANGAGDAGAVGFWVPANVDELRAVMHPRGFGFSETAKSVIKLIVDFSETLPDNVLSSNNIDVTIAETIQEMVSRGADTPLKRLLTPEQYSQLKPFVDALNWKDLTMICGEFHDLQTYPAADPALQTKAFKQYYLMNIIIMNQIHLRTNYNVSDVAQANDLAGVTIFTYVKTALNYQTMRAGEGINNLITRLMELADEKVKLTMPLIESRQGEQYQEIAQAVTKTIDMIRSEIGYAPSGGANAAGSVESIARLSVLLSVSQLAKILYPTEEDLKAMSQNAQNVVRLIREHEKGASTFNPMQLFYNDAVYSLPWYEIAMIWCAFDEETPYPSKNPNPGTPKKVSWVNTYLLDAWEKGNTYKTITDETQAAKMAGVAKVREVTFHRVELEHLHKSIVADALEMASDEILYEAGRRSHEQFLRNTLESLTAVHDEQPYWDIKTAAYNEIALIRELRKGEYASFAAANGMLPAGEMNPVFAGMRGDLTAVFQGDLAATKRVADYFSRLDVSIKARGGLADIKDIRAGDILYRGPSLGESNNSQVPLIVIGKYPNGIEVAYLDSGGRQQNTTITIGSHDRIVFISQSKGNNDLDGIAAATGAANGAGDKPQGLFSEELREIASDRKVLIVDPDDVRRENVRKFLIDEAGFKEENIRVAEYVYLADQILKSGFQPDLIINNTDHVGMEFRNQLTVADMVSVIKDIPNPAPNASSLTKLRAKEKIERWLRTQG